MTLFFRTILALLSLALTAPATFGNTLGDPPANSETELKISYSIAALPQSQTESEHDLWARIRSGFKLPESDPRLTRVHEQGFAKNAAHIERIAERSRPYLFYIVEEVERRGMPMEIALLPMIESAFNPQAQSPMKASGIWQFMPSTGKVYGLQQNAWYDGRRDILQATNAALDYLQKLYGMFGDWELALAAYNCGEGCVGRAQSRGAGSDYASIKLPTETRNYVPKLVAVRNIILEPQRFGIHLETLPDEPYFLQVKLKHPMEARQAARLAEMDLAAFLSLNPAFQRRVIFTETQNVLLLPADKIETFQFNLHQQGSQNRLQNYAAQRGENANGIASKFGVSLAWLKENNPLKLFKGKVAQTQTLVVPMVKVTVALPATAKIARDVPAKRPVMRTHTVRKGDTLARVAKIYNVKIADIREWNENAEPLRLGSKLAIPLTS
ncbi:MAG: transglycosylase SLT domain-containing protein [Pseudomonadota bacterium]|nr:transglycosylase SLT domain-containing protein [Pseudomonadota bacterium]